MITPTVRRIKQSERFQAVLSYQKRGFSIIPIGNDKKPCIAWKEYQCRCATEDELLNWWTTWPGANIGIVTGKISGITVVDCDSEDAVLLIEETLPDSFLCLISKTPRGGRHYYFSYQPARRTGAEILPGVDIRNDGGYVVAPPSMTSCGEYVWICESELNGIPEGLLKKLINEAIVTALPFYDGSPDPSLAGLKELDLRQHLIRFESLVFNDKGFSLCPVHTETEPSFEAKRHSDGHWYWFDWHNQGRDGFCGTIIDFYTTIKRMAVGEAIRTIKEREGIQESKPPVAPMLQPSATVNLPSARKPFRGTLQDFILTDIPEPDPLITGLLARQEFMLLGGVKHAHKTSIMMNLGLYFASGKSPWLGFEIPRPGRFLMIQQELGEAEFKKRLQKTLASGGFYPENFYPFTGTGNPIHLLDDRGFTRAIELVEEFKPDIIGLDPLHTFHTSNENNYEVHAKVRDRMNYLKTTYDAAVILSQHFTSKRPANDPLAPSEAAGWFRGHSVLADAADVLLCLHRLPGQKENSNLRLQYEDYNMVEVTLRNGKWPPRFATEFDSNTFTISRSNVWSDIGSKISYGEIRDVSEAHGGQILLSDLIKYFQGRFPGISPHTVKKAVEREKANGYVTIENLPGKGRPILVRSSDNVGRAEV